MMDDGKLKEIRHKVKCGGRLPVADSEYLLQLLDNRLDAVGYFAVEVVKLRNDLQELSEYVPSLKKFADTIYKKVCWDDTNDG